MSALCPIDLPKTDKEDDEPFADSIILEVADEACLVLVSNALLCFRDASWKRLGWVTVRGIHGYCEH